MNDHMHDIINASLKERGLPTIEQGAKPIGSIFGLTDISSSAPLSEQLDEETHLRYGYIPFVIAEVAPRHATADEIVETIRATRETAIKFSSHEL